MAYRPYDHFSRMASKTKLNKNLKKYISTEQAAISKGWGQLFLE